MVVHRVAFPHCRQTYNICFAVFIIHFLHDGEGNKIFPQEKSHFPRALNKSSYFSNIRAILKNVFFIPNNIWLYKLSGVLIIFLFFETKSSSNNFSIFRKQNVAIVWFSITGIVSPFFHKFESWIVKLGFCDIKRIKMILKVWFNIFCLHRMLI